MNYCDLAPPYIRSIAPYQPGKPISELERELGITGIVKLASNENPLGASPAAVAAMQEAIKTIALYPDGNGFDLKDALVKRYGVTHANVTLGNGSNDLLELAARAFLTPGTKSSIRHMLLRSTHWRHKPSVQPASASRPPKVTGMIFRRC